jgi:osmotically-inducible protein OsmY
MISLNLKRFAMAVTVGLTLASGSAYGQDATQSADQPAAGWSQDDVLRIAQEVRKKILSLPEYAVFDDIHFGIQGKTVILYGYASRPILKTSAEKAVKSIKGVESVDNQIEVLPASPNDDRIREAVYRAIYSAGPLQKYSGSRGFGPSDSIARRAGGITNDPPMGYHAIHIIVKNGNVILTGVVLNEMDAAVAEMRANQVSGAFSVKNELVVQNQPSNKEKK